MNIRRNTERVVPDRTDDEIIVAALERWVNSRSATGHMFLCDADIDELNRQYDRVPALIARFA